VLITLWLSLCCSVSYCLSTALHAHCPSLTVALALPRLELSGLAGLHLQACTLQAAAALQPRTPDEVRAGLLRTQAAEAAALFQSPPDHVELAARLITPAAREPAVWLREVMAAVLGGRGWR